MRNPEESLADVRRGYRVTQLSWVRKSVAIEVERGHPGTEWVALGHSGAEVTRNLYIGRAAYDGWRQHETL